MTATTRIRLLVAAAAAVAASATVGATLLYDDPPAPAGARKGAPPLLLDLGTRQDPQARALRRAETLYDRGDRDAAGAIFARYPRDLDAQIGSALARWPRSSTRTLEALAREHPRRSVVRLHVGLARYWEGDRGGADQAWREAELVEPDTPSALRAEDLLHPQFARGRPTFSPSKLRPGSLLHRGALQQRLGHPVTARRLFDRAAALDPDDPEALTASAVGRFDKDDPAAAFARLGPLTARFPGSPTVRFHLGLLLLWTGRVEEGKRQLGLVRTGRLEMEAKRILVRLVNVS